MKGFYIEITNNLLEPKHRKAMKESVWLFMWLLDKITSISEEGIGKILGGKPIKYEEVNEDLDIPERTYKRWISILRKNDYINVQRAPYGLIISVNRAKKRFGQRYAKFGTREIGQKVYSDVPKSVERCATKVGSNIRQDKDNTRQFKENQNKEKLKKLKAIFVPGQGWIK